MASYSSSDLAKLFSGDDDSFRDDVLDEVTSEKLFDEIYADGSDNSRLALLARLIEPEKDRLLALARTSQGTIAPSSSLIRYM
jgi:hypothetical protein